MKTIDNYVVEKMVIDKNIKPQKIKNQSSKSNNLYVEIQNEIDKNGEYHTYSFKDGQKKFKKGFLTFNEDNEFFTITTFNNAKDFAEMLDAYEDEYDSYENINVGECIDYEEHDGSTSQILRIW